MTEQLEHLIVSVHGIRTFGDWQNRLMKLTQAKNKEVEFQNYQYGYFSLLAFIFPLTRWLVVRRFRRELLRLVAVKNPKRLDLVGHSFGTHIIAWSLHSLRARTDLRVHTLILAGSVLRSDFYWGELIPSVVGRVINDCGSRDTVLLASQFLVLFTGMAGRTGFVGMNGPEFVNRYFEFGHSGYFQDRNRKPNSYMEDRWLPLLLSSDRPIYFDERTAPSPLEGIGIWLTNNFEPIKLAVAISPLLAALLYVGALYVRSEAATEKIAAVASLAKSLKYTHELDGDRLLDTIEHGLGAGLQRTAVLWLDDHPEWNELERNDLTRFGLCFALARSTQEALSYLQANPGRFAVIISDFKREDDPKQGYGMLDELKSRDLHIPLIFYVADHTDAQAKDAVRHGARAEVNDPIELLSEVVRALPSEAKEPGRIELLEQKVVGCRWMWRESR
ncbi:hypothetical protein ACWAUC_19635 [Bradyrhizobium guangdongense]